MFEGAGGVWTVADTGTESDAGEDTEEATDETEVTGAGAVFAGATDCCDIRVGGVTV